MAKNKDARPPTFAVSVVGLSGTEKEKGNCGVGKSCLCNRYVRPDADSYYSEHTSVLSTIDFGGRVVNNDHFLYWGEVSHRGDDGLDCKIQIIEQTEFIDDQTFLPHRSTNLQPYTKRAAATKLQSAEKLMYICTDQLGLEQDFDQKQMPDGKLNIDGFLLCIDVSKGCNRKFDDQMKFVNSLYSQIVKSKKPIVVAATKCDDCVDQNLRELQGFVASKKNLLLIETSARSNVNVELCFNALIQQLDKTRGKPKTVPYLEAYKIQRQLVASVTERFEKLMVHSLRDYHTTWKTVANNLKGQPDYDDFITLEGSRKARNMFTKHIAQLKQEHIRKRREEYLTTLPKTLNNLLNNLEEVEHLSWPEAQSVIRNRSDFHYWFVVLEQTPWDETDHIDNSDRRIPFDLLDTPDGERIYHNHVQHLLSEKRRVEMKERFKKTLERVHFISPGQPWEEVMCFVMEDEAYKYITESDRRDVYCRHQQEIVERAKEDFQEMLFEHAELFYDLDLNATPSCDKMSEIHSVLNEEPRYRALQKLAPDRESLLLKHIGFVYHPTKETCLSGQNCVDLKVEQVLANRLVQLDHGRTNVYYNSANIDKINLCLLGREGLSQELANEIRAQSTDDEYTLDGKIYELELLPVDVNSTLLFSHSWVNTFKPHGCFCVFNSIESLNCIGDCIGRIRAEIQQSRRDRFAQPLPFILILANQRDSVCKNIPILKHQGQQLANKLQCTFVDIPSGAFPRKFTEFQIKQGLRAVLEGLKHNFDVLAPLPCIKDMSETDLRIVMCAMCWDPFSVDLILSPFLDSHCCSAGQPGQSNTLILDKIIGDSRRRIQVTVLSYHSAIGVRKDELVHGYILVYSAKRKASMATLRAFLAEVQDVIPVQMVAITDSQADFFENDAIKELMTEGEHIATEIAAKFTALYSLSQYHRQTEVFTPFFNEVLEKKPSIESSFLFDSSSRECTTGASEDVFPTSPHSHSPAYNTYYPESDDDNEAPPPYSPIGDDVQLLPTPSERAKYRIDLEGNEYPVHSTPVGDHERNHKVPPPVRPKPVLPKPNVKKLDPNLLKTIEAGMRSNRRMPRGPITHTEDVEASDNYADPADTLLRSRGFHNDDIYAVPDDTHSRLVKIRNSYGGLHGLHGGGEEENGFDRKSQAGRRPSKYKHRSKILFSKTKAYQRRFQSDSDGEESGPATQKKKKGRAHRGSEEDPLLSPADPWKGGIDNPAITSDPEQEDKKMKKKKTPKTPKEPKKPRSKPPKPLYPPTRRNWESNYFGVPLQSLVTPDRPIPLFIEKCVEYIERTGRGVFTQEYIEPKSFVVEYRGVLSLSDGVDDKNSKYTFDFTWNGKHYSIDASKEDGTLGRLVNDDHIHPNCKVKRIMVKGRPHLCLFAVKEMFPGEEITYIYGDSSWPWRSMEGSGGTDDMMAVVSSTPATSKDDTEGSGGTDDMMAVVSSTPATSKDDTEGSGGTDDMMAVVSSTPATSKDDTGKEKAWTQGEAKSYKGLTSEGLYRISGNKTDQDNIQKQFDQDHNIDFVVMDVAVNAAAGALKAFFADLPDPLIPYSLHPELVEAAKIVDYIERLQVLREIVKKFPPVNYQVFKYIITHLNRVSQQHKTTLMTADNLSICFWPTLMRPDFENKDTLSTTKLNQAVIESFILQSNYFFHGGEVAESSSSEGTPPPHCHNMVEALLPLQLPPPLQPQQIQHTLHPDPLI